ESARVRLARLLRIVGIDRTRALQRVAADDLVGRTRASLCRGDVPLDGGGAGLFHSDVAGFTHPAAGGRIVLLGDGAARFVEQLRPERLARKLRRGMGRLGLREL